MGTDLKGIESDGKVYFQLDKGDIQGLTFVNTIMSILVPHKVRSILIT
jgi:hypothetical protein